MPKGRRLLEVEFFFKGILIGLTIAAPVGPIGILCLRRTIAKGKIAGLVSGFGASLADTLYGLLALFGLSIIQDTLLCCLPWFAFFGALFLIVLGVTTYFKKFVLINEPQRIQNYLGYFSSTFFLTLTNPMTLFAFLAIFTAVGFVEERENYLTGMLLIIGIFLGSMSWWLLIGEGTSFFRKRLPQNLLLYLNKFAGILLVGFGVIVLINLAVSYWAAA